MGFENREIEEIHSNPERIVSITPHQQLPLLFPGIYLFFSKYFPGLKIVNGPFRLRHSIPPFHSTVHLSIHCLRTQNLEICFVYSVSSVTSWPFV